LAYLESKEVADTLTAPLASTSIGIAIVDDVDVRPYSTIGLASNDGNSFLDTAIYATDIDSDPSKSHKIGIAIVEAELVKPYRTIGSASIAGNSTLLIAIVILKH
jgi:hypothetical protein